MSDIEQERAIIAEVIVTAWKDQAYREKLAGDPAGVLREAGLELPADCRVTLMEDTGDVSHISIPRLEDMAATDKERFMAELAGLVPVPAGDRGAPAPGHRGRALLRAAAAAPGDRRAQRRGAQDWWSAATAATAGAGGVFGGNGGAGGYLGNARPARRQRRQRRRRLTRPGRRSAGRGRRVTNARVVTRATARAGSRWEY